MKLYSRAYFATVFLIGLVCTGVTWWGNDYMREFDRTVEIVEKYAGPGTGKYASTEFILVFKTEDGRYSDAYVSPSTYHRLNVGDTTTMTLREFDIEQTPLNNFLWFFMALVVYVLGSFIILFGALGFCSSSVRKYISEKQL